MGDAERLDSHYAEAREFYERALAAFRRAGEGRGRGTALTALADVEYRLNRYAQSRDLCQQAATILEDQGDMLGQIPAQLGLALVSLAGKRPQEFQTHLEHARGLARSQGFPAIMDEVSRIERLAGGALVTVAHEPIAAVHYACTQLVLVGLV